MIRRPPRSTPKPSSAASDVYKRQCVMRLVLVVDDQPLGLSHPAELEPRIGHRGHLNTPISRIRHRLTGGALRERAMTSPPDRRAPSARQSSPELYERTGISLKGTVSGRRARAPQASYAVRPPITVRRTRPVSSDPLPSENGSTSVSYTHLTLPTKA